MNCRKNKSCKIRRRSIQITTIFVMKWKIYTCTTTDYKSIITQKRDDHDIKIEN